MVNTCNLCLALLLLLSADVQGPVLKTKLSSQDLRGVVGPLGVLKNAGS
jgi:hypothetical protein